MTNLYTKSLLSLVALAVVMGLLLFLPAGTTRYWQAWVYLAIFFGASLLTTLYLIKKDPALLKRRMSGGPTAEKEPAQRIIMVFASLGFIGLLVVPALDYRFGWSTVPLSVVVAGDVLVAIGFYFIFHRAIRVGTPPNVRERIAIPYRHPACPRLLLGTPRTPFHDVIPDMAAL
jgi:archaellum biogenesis protein FlaJ (TadC family)